MIFFRKHWHRSQTVRCSCLVHIPKSGQTTLSSVCLYLFSSRWFEVIIRKFFYFDVTELVLIMHYVAPPSSVARGNGTDIPGCQTYCRGHQPTWVKKMLTNDKGPKCSNSNSKQFQTIHFTFQSHVVAKPNTLYFTFVVFTKTHNYQSVTTY